MAVMTVGAAGIETISGAMKRPKKQNGHSHGNYLVATHRVAATTNPNCQRVYSFEADRYERSTQPTSKELATKPAKKRQKSPKEWHMLAYVIFLLYLCSRFV